MKQIFDSDTYITMKNYHDGALLVPSINFTMYMSRCENLFLAYFKENKHLPGIGEKIVKILEKVNKPVECQQFPQTYLLRLFVRVRIHYVLRFENRSNCQQKILKKNWLNYKANKSSAFSSALCFRSYFLTLYKFLLSYLRDLTVLVIIVYLLLVKCLL